MKMMGNTAKTGKLFLLLIVSVALVHIVQVVQASGAEPGSDKDPLVSQSYVDSKVNEMGSVVSAGMDKLKESDDSFAQSIDEISKKLEELIAQNEAYKTMLESQTKKNAEYKTMIDKMSDRINDAEKYGKFEALELNEKQVLIAGESAEIILRGGKAKAIGGKGGGLSDITSGTGADIGTDQDVPLNHLLMISRDDGRGLKVVSQKAWVLVKGPYTIDGKKVEVKKDDMASDVEAETENEKENENEKEKENEDDVTGTEESGD